MIDPNSAAKRAQALLTRQPPITDEAAQSVIQRTAGGVGSATGRWPATCPGQTHEAPPPGTGPILVVKDSGEAHYLGSQSIEHELERAAEDLRRDL